MHLQKSKMFDTAKDTLGLRVKTKNALLGIALKSEVSSD